MTELKVLHVIPSLLKGGAERITLDICYELQQRDHVLVKLITFRDENTYSFLSNKIGHEVIPSRFIPSLKGKDLIEVDQLQKSVESFNPDIVHLHLFESVMIMSTVEVPNAKWIIHFHDNMIQLKKHKLNTFLNKSSLTNYYERSLVLKKFRSRNVHCLAISKDTLQFIRQNLGSKFSSSLLFNSIDTKRFAQGETVRAQNRIVNIGSFVAKKGQELAIRTVSELKKRGIIVQLDLLGDGEMRLHLETLTKELNLENEVIFHGNVDYPEIFLSEAMLYIHTASYEPFGLVLVEAMAAGLPVVSTDGKGNRELIVEGENGFMIWNRNPEHLADKIELLLTNDSLRNQMANNAKKFSSTFSIESYVDELIKIYGNEN